MQLLVRPFEKATKSTCERHGSDSKQCMRLHRIEGAAIGASVGGTVGALSRRWKVALWTAASGAAMGAVFPDAARFVQDKRDGKNGGRRKKD